LKEKNFHTYEEDLHTYEEDLDGFWTIILAAHCQKYAATEGHQDTAVS
jgi:hypothetical protein